jgi:hypothetical protein
MKNLARRASSQAKDVTDKWGLSEETTAGLIKLALYDFILLCGEHIFPLSRFTLDLPPLVS